MVVLGVAERVMWNRTVMQEPMLMDSNYPRSPRGNSELFLLSSTSSSSSEEDLCERCGREGHDKDQCYARTDSRGRPILSNKEKTYTKKAQPVTGPSRNQLIQSFNETRKRKVLFPVSVCSHYSLG